MKMGVVVVGPCWLVVVCVVIVWGGSCENGCCCSGSMLARCSLSGYCLGW